VTHSEFVEAYSSGSIRVHVDRGAAARYLSARLLLPLVTLPVLGVGVALALTGWFWTGLAVIAVATLGRICIRHSAPHFVITQALQDSKFYEDITTSGVLQILDAIDESSNAASASEPQERR
jgi:hypothetical protein